MSRILFAAARGARVQYRYPTWVDPDLWDDGNTQLYGALMAQVRYKAHLRIHPEDEHLQYGPISSALREAAEAGNRWDLTGWHGRMADAAATYQAAWWYASEPVRTLYLLILSECLADEGL